MIDRNAILDFIIAHRVGGGSFRNSSGDFALRIGADDWDLYGSIDAAYSLHILGALEETTPDGRERWARRLLECQDEAGWFTKRNIRGHGKEHATAYALGALTLLGAPDNRDYLDLAKPLTDADDLLLDPKRFRKWIRRLGFKIDFKDPVGGAGWNYVWRNSHIVGGVAAAVGMRRGD
ncbi:MAG: hypothetical protein GF419_01135, partial [Ignavibacteriales bacterium]|nr:hypothetical protein [Ignavibacteriales bacterium]